MDPSAARRTCSGVSTTTDPPARPLPSLDPRRFANAERLGFFGFGCALALLSILPYVAFRLAAPPDRLYVWASTFYFDDYFQYHAWANAIADGDWAIRDRYTHNPEASFALFNPYFFALGIATRLLGDSFVAYHALRLALAPVFALLLGRFLENFLPRPRDRFVALALCLGGGLEYPFYLLFRERPATPLADPYVFKILYRYGHLTASLCLLLALLDSCARLARDRGAGTAGATRAAIVAGGCIAVLGAINPYYLVLAAAIAGGFAALRLLRGDGRFARVLVALGVGGSLPALHYYLQPVSSSLDSIAFDDPVSPFDLFLFFAPLLPFAVAGGRRRRGGWKDEMDEKDRKDGIDEAIGKVARAKDAAAPLAPAALIFVWLAVPFLASLTPLAFKARLSFGAQIPLAILAARGLGNLPFARAGRIATFAALSLVLAVDPAFTFYKEWIDATRRGVGALDRSLVAALEVLDARARPGDVVLCTSDVGNVVPAFTRANVYVGHSFQTENYYEKNEASLRFFAETEPSARAAFAESVGADWIVVPPVVNRIRGEFAIPGWTKSYERSGWSVLGREAVAPNPGGAPTGRNAPEATADSPRRSSSEANR